MTYSTTADRSAAVRPGVAASTDTAARHRAPVVARPGSSRAWTGAAALFAALGVGCVVLLPGDAGAAQVPERLVTADPVAEPTPVHAGMRLAAAAEPPAVVLLRSEPVRVEIPALGLSSPVMGLGLTDDGSMEVPPGARPAGWYDGSPTPGELGPAVLAGHVDWAGQAGVFAGLDQLDPGDEVRVDRVDGSTVTFTVDRVAEYAKDGFPTETVYGDVPYAGLRLITCGGAFDEDEGDYLDNVVVYARLTAGG